MFKVLVCGGRDYQDYPKLASVMEDIVKNYTPDASYLLIIQGGALGADNMARLWATSEGIHSATIPALWNTYGKRAGYLRNSVMAEMEPDLCVAFPGGKGTKMMVDLCKKKGIEVMEVV